MISFAYYFGVPQNGMRWKRKGQKEAVNNKA